MKFLLMFTQLYRDVTVQKHGSSSGQIVHVNVRNIAVFVELSFTKNEYTVKMLVNLKLIKVHRG